MTHLVNSIMSQLCMFDTHWFFIKSLLRGSSQRPHIVVLVTGRNDKSSCCGLITSEQMLCAIRLDCVR